MAKPIGNYPVCSVDAMRVQSIIGAGERITVKQVCERVVQYGLMGKSSPVSVRVLAALVHLMKRGRLLLKSRMQDGEVRSMDSDEVKYMQLEGCMYVLVLNAVRQRRGQE